MATHASNSKAKCFMCKKEKVVYLCDGCCQKFCFQDLTKHHQDNEKEFDSLITDCDVFRQQILEIKKDNRQHPLMEQVNEWEKNSIQRIKEAAQECRQKLLNIVEKNIRTTQKKLNEFIDELKRIRQDNDFNEIHINKLRTSLTQLESQLREPSNISITESNTSYIGEISVTVTQNIPINLRWTQVGVTVAGGHGRGNATNQLNKPYGLTLDDDQTMLIADHYNHRIMEWKIGDNNGRVVAGDNGPGNRLDQLNYPTNILIDKQTSSLIICDCGNQRVVRWSLRSGTTQGAVIINNIKYEALAMDSEGYLYVSDAAKHEVRKYRIGEKEGVVVAGGNDAGDALNQLNTPTFLFVDACQAIFVADHKNHRVVKWNKGATEGIVVAGGQGEGSALNQLSRPSGLFVDSNGTVYVADSNNHRVMRWADGAKEGTVIVGGKGKGTGADQLDWPISLAFDNNNNLYVLEYSNQRLQRFTYE